MRWLAEGRYRAALRVEVAIRTGRDPLTEVLDRSDPAEVREADGEYLRTFAALCAAGPAR